MLRSLSSFLAALFALTLGIAPALARPDGIFDVGRYKAQKAVITVGDTIPATVPPAGSPRMLQNLAGIVAILPAKDITPLNVASLTGLKLVDARGNLSRLCVLHLSVSESSPVKRVEILTSPDGVILARELIDSKDAAADSAKVFKLDPERFRQATLDWPRYRGSYGADLSGLDDPSAKTQQTLPPGSPVELAHPIAPSPFFLDQKSLGDRFLNGRRSNIPGAARILSQEKLVVRLPTTYKPRRPAGLLIWIHAASEGTPPAVFNKSLDELNIACVGIANVGNDRPVADRYQLALDALFAVSARVHIDPTRVYLAGISGGGRVSSMLLACFPDYFTGAVPIVGLSTYQKVPLGNSRFAPAGYERPDIKRFTLLKKRRIAAITGGEDFNHSEILAAADIMRGHGVNIRVFDFEKLGHQMPSADEFLGALKWVDQPWQDAWVKNTQAAGALLEKYKSKRGDIPPPDDKARAELYKVIDTAPWSDPAWEAASLIRKP